MVVDAQGEGRGGAQGEGQGPQGGDVGHQGSRQGYGQQAPASSGFSTSGRVG